MLIQYAFYAVCVILGISLYSGLVLRTRAGSWFDAAARAFIASPGMILVLAVAEHRNPLDLIDFSRQSWAVLIGDAFALPAAAAVAALAWRDKTRSIFWRSSVRWTIGFAVIGLSAGIAFHLVDSVGYAAAGAADALDSPTKVWHDFVSYPVLFGGLFCIGGPVVFTKNRTWHSWVLVACLAVWIILVIRDTNFGHLDPNWLHPAWDADTFTPRR